MTSRVLVALVASGACLLAGCLDDPKNGKDRSAQAITSTQVTYAYDALGRLIQAASSDGNGVEYNYDEVGNITAIHRLSATAIGVLDFVPRTGLPGNQVTIYGGGFDLTASANTVTFNGVSAVVSAATATTLTVSVPPAATTGPIGVTNSRGSGLSATSYTVLGTSPIPTITSFAPKVVTRGTVVTLSGTNFQLDPRDDKLEIGSQLASVVHDATSPAATQLKLAVPSASASGHIALTTPYGTAVSADELIAVPATVAPALVEFTARVTLGGPPLTVSTMTAGDKAVILFDAQAGQLLHIVTTAGTIAGTIRADIYDPSGNLAQTATLNNYSVRDLPLPLPLTGTYTAILSPGSIGSVSFSLVADLTGALALEGSTPITLLPGQNGSYSFPAQANTGYGLALSALSFTAGGGTVNVRVFQASGGAQVASCTFTDRDSCNFDPSSFPAAGTYVVVFDPAGSTGATFNAVLSTDVTGTITIDQPPTVVRLARAGQNARFTFVNSTANQRAHVVLDANALDDGSPSTNNSTQILVVGPSGGTVANGSFSTILPGQAIDLTLTAVGTYTVVVNPGGLDFGTVDLAVKTEASGPMTLDGATAIELSAGRNGRYTFTAQAVTGYGLGVTPLHFTPDSGAPTPTLNITLRSADGTALTTCSFQSEMSCNFDPTNFATTGTYLLDFNPIGIYAASFTANLSTDVMGTTNIGSIASIKISRPGQNARYTFPGTAGQVIDMTPDKDSIGGDPSSGDGTQVQLVSPSGMVIANVGFGPLATHLTRTATLPQTGTYTIVVDPMGNNFGSVLVATGIHTN